MKSLAYDIEAEAGKGNDSLQRLNIEICLLGAQPTTINLSIWEDGEFWLSVVRRNTRKKGGWAFKDSLYGNVLHISGSDFVKHVEQTLVESAPSQPDKNRSLLLRKIWENFRPAS